MNGLHWRVIVCKSTIQSTEWIKYLDFAFPTVDARHGYTFGFTPSSPAFFGGRHRAGVGRKTECPAETPDGD